MSATSTDPIHVLHVDDDSEFVELAATFVEHKEEYFEVETATSALDGLEQLTDDDARNTITDGVDCIVSDYDMPEMNGLVFLEAVRKKCPDLPFILFTGKPDREIASKAITVGASRFLSKETGTEQYTVLANCIENLVL